MRKQINIIAKLFIAVAISANLTACDNKETPAVDAKPTVKIGVSFPLTSGHATIVEEVKNAMMYASKKYENSPVKMELIFEDNSNQAARAMSVASKLIHVDKVNAIISNPSAVAKLTSPLATKANVLHIGGAMEALHSSNPTSFAMWSQPITMVEKYMEYLKKENVKNLGVLVLNNESTENLYKPLEKKLKEEGIKFKKYSFIPGQVNYMVDLMKIKNQDHDMLTFLLHSPESDIIAKQYRESGIDIPISAIDTVPVASNKSLYNDVIYVDLYQGDEKILKEVQQNINSKGTHAFAIFMDSLDLIHKVSEDFYKKNKRMPNGTEANEMIMKMKKFSGVSGEITINDNRTITPPAKFYTIKDGKTVLIEEK